jgi:16S rRNA (uracil1498-N3)-methyltransferase
MKPPASAKNGARFHIPDTLGPGAELDLPDTAGHHATRVLRLGVGDPVVLFDGRGGEHDAAITRVHRNEVAVRVTAFRDVDRESTLSVTLVQGISSGDRMDITLRKAVELGVAAIVPVATERSVVKLRDERADRRRQHWQALAIAACEQCGRNTVPAVAEPVDFRAWLAELPKAPGTQSRIALAVGGETRLAELPKPAGDILLLVGPEGGLSPEEAALAGTRGFTPVRMGPRILRTETAAVVALAAMQTLWGDL